MLFEPCVRFRGFGYLMDRLLGNSCSLGLRYVLSIYIIVNLVFPTSVLGVGISF